MDTIVMDRVLSIIRDEQPRLVMINLPEADERGHDVGGPASPDIMTEVMMPR